VKYCCSLFIGFRGNNGTAWRKATVNIIILQKWLSNCSYAEKANLSLKRNIFSLWRSLKLTETRSPRAGLLKKHHSLPVSLQREEKATYYYVSFSLKKRRNEEKAIIVLTWLRRNGRNREEKCGLCGYSSRETYKYTKAAFLYKLSTVKHRARLMTICQSSTILTLFVYSVLWWYITMTVIFSLECLCVPFRLCLSGNVAAMWWWSAVMMSACQAV